MGYTTEFRGAIDLDPPLNDEEIAYLTAFADSRRMHRRNGPYFTDGTGFKGQHKDHDVIDHNRPDPEQPGLWCQWVPSENDRSQIEWDGGEKFYEAAEWMEYILQHFILPGAIAKQKHPEEFAFLQGHTANGFIECQGEDSDDRWCIDVTDGIVSTRQGVVEYR